MTSDTVGNQPASRLGFAGCRLSGPLQAETVLDYARRENMPIKDTEAVRLKISTKLQARFEVRLIDCRSIDKSGLVEGARYFAAIKDWKIDEIILDEIAN